MARDRCAELDHLANLDVGGRNNRPLAAAVEAGAPSSYRAAKLLHEAAAAGEAVIITTGFPITAADAPETDGPPGAVALASALDAIGAHPVFAVDALNADVVSTLADRVGVGTAPVEMVPVDRAAAADEAAALLEEYEPGACVAIERPGRCGDGTYRNMAGEDVSDLAGKVDELFDAAAGRDIPTVGVGDGGNEIGMGSVTRAVQEHVDNGDRIAAETTTDVLVVAGVSNWGAYAVVGALSLLAGERLLHDGERETDRIRVCIDAGAVDGVTAEQIPAVDGLAGSLHASVVDLLDEIVADGLAE